MAKAASNAVPEAYKPQHDSGANHSSPWAQEEYRDLGELTVKQLIIQTIGDKCACCKRDMSGEGKTAYGLAKFKIPDCDLELIFICLDCCRQANDLIKGERFVAEDFIDWRRTKASAVEMGLIDNTKGGNVADVEKYVARAGQSATWNGRCGICEGAIAANAGTTKVRPLGWNHQFASFQDTIICYRCHEKERKGCDNKGDWSLEKVRKFFAERDARTAVQRQEVEGDCLVCHKETAKYDRYTSVMFGYPAVTHEACKFYFAGYIRWHLAVKKVEDIMTDVLGETIVADFARVKQTTTRSPASKSQMQTKLRMATISFAQLAREVRPAARRRDVIAQLGKRDQEVVFCCSLSDHLRGHFTPLQLQRIQPRQSCDFATHR